MIAIVRSDPKYELGQLVRHVRYGYRGVIVALDLTCKAPMEWYTHNKTQPPRDQPWYHVLVDGATHATYAAETSLAADILADPIDNPAVEIFFGPFEDGRYARNDRTWPGWPE